MSIGGGVVATSNGAHFLCKAPESNCWLTCEFHSALEADYLTLGDVQLEHRERAAAAGLGAQPAVAPLRIDDGPDLDASVPAVLAEGVPGLALVVVDRPHVTRDARRPMSGPADALEAQRTYAPPSSAPPAPPFGERPAQSSRV